MNAVLFLGDLPHLKDAGRLEQSNPSVCSRLGAFTRHWVAERASIEFLLRPASPTTARTAIGYEPSLGVGMTYQNR